MELLALHLLPQTSPDRKESIEQIEKMRTFEKRQEEFGSELETEALSKICFKAEAVNSEVKRLIENYIEDGDIEEMRNNMLSIGESDEDKEKLFKQAIQFVVNDKKEIEETGIEELTDILIASSY